MHKTITECLDVIGASRADVENWLRHQELQTTYAATIAGRARPFGRENVEELALTAAHVRAGRRPGEAIALAAMSRRQRAAGHLKEWVIMGVGETSGITTNEITAEHLEAATSGAVASAHIVRVGEVFRRVDALFSGEPADVSTNESKA